MTDDPKADDSHEVLKDMTRADEEQPGEQPANDLQRAGNSADAATDKVQ